jgi:hypothetical protein
MFERIHASDFDVVVDAQIPFRIEISRRLDESPQLSLFLGNRDFPRHALPSLRL